MFYIIYIKIIIHTRVINYLSVILLVSLDTFKFIRLTSLNILNNTNFQLLQQENFSRDVINQPDQLSLAIRLWVNLLGGDALLERKGMYGSCLVASKRSVIPCKMRAISKRFSRCFDKYYTIGTLEVGLIQ